MSRIAEFAESDDAMRFANMKGDDFTVVGGINLPYAVMPKVRYPLNCGPFEPSDAGGVVPCSDPDDVDFDSDLTDEETR